jgi:thiol-disulfide isomerase/thioredoxin
MFHRGRSFQRTRAATAVLVAIALLPLVGCSRGHDAVADGDTFSFVSPDGRTDIFYPAEERKVVPEIAGESLLRDDAEVSTHDYTGKILVLNIWGQWCPPCRVEAPEMQTLQDRFGDVVQVIGLDVRDFDKTAPQDFMRDRGLTYPSIYDPSGRTLLNLSGYPRNITPSTIVLDERHRVAAVFLRTLLASDLAPVIQRLSRED